MNTDEKNNQHSKNKEYKLEEQTSVAEESAIVYEAKRYSYADYLTWTDDIMREIIDGIVYVFSAPLRKHAVAVRTIFGRAFNFIDKRKAKCEIYTAPFDVRFPTDGATDNDKIYNVVQPDICVICDPSKLDDGGCIGAPDLIVEVLSPSTAKKDLGKKFNLYQEFGVKEYWIVCPNNKIVTVFILQPDGKYDEGNVFEVSRGVTRVPVQTLKGLDIELNELFID